MESTLRPRPAVAATLAALAFAAALFFYGSQVNYLLLALSVTLAFTAIVVAGLRVDIPAWAMIWLCLLVLAIVVAHLVSPSPDSSFVVAWVLGLIPLGTVLGMALGDSRKVLWSATGGGAVLLAAISAVRLCLDGTRPAAPLTDANSYGALLYVVLFILAGRLLDRPWQGLSSRLWYPGLAAVMLLAFVIAGTQSRACSFILLAGAVFSTLYAFRHRLALQPLVAVLGAGLTGVLVHDLVIATTPVVAGAESIAGGLAVRMVLIQSALQMYLSEPLSGIGLYVFPLLYRQIRTAADDDTAGLFVHNDYVQLLVEGGPLLLLPVLALGCWLGVVLWRAFSSESRFLIGDRLGCVFALGALLAHAQINFVLYTPVFALLCGFLIAAILKLPVRAGSTLRGLPGAVLLPVFVFGAFALGLLWVDVTTGVKLQGQPGIPLLLEPAVGQEQQLDYARRAQQLNADRGLPFLAEAFILDQDRADLGADAERLVLQAYRRAVAVDPWNTYAWWQFRDFIRRTPAIRDALRASEAPEAITREVLRLDPLFVPAIEGMLAALADDNVEGTRQRRLAFLRAHVGPRLTWLARLDPPAALHYVDVLLKYPESDTDHAHWAAVRERILAVEPLRPERWFVSSSG